MRPVTQKDIATKLGLDDSTVSLALRNSDKISAETQKLVLKTANEMGYRLNAIASSLSKFRKNTSETPVSAALAWLNCWETPQALYQQREFAQYWEGAKNTATRLGYNLEEFIIDTKMPAKRTQEIIETRGIKGVLIPPHPPSAAQHLEQFEWADFAIMRFGRSVPHPASHITAADQYTNMLLAYDKVSELGYQRIGMVSVPRNHTNWINFDTGYLKAQEQRAESERIPIYYDTPIDQEPKLKDFAQWLEQYQPDAIISGTGGVKTLVEGIGLEPGTDIGLATMTVLDTSIDAGINQNSYQIGRIAVRNLISQIHDQDTGIPELFHQISVPGSWMDGSMLPPKN